MIINRADLVPEGTLLLRRYAEECDIPIICEMPLDPLVMKATRNGEPFTLYEGHSAGKMRNAVDRLVDELHVS